MDHHNEQDRAQPIARRAQLALLVAAALAGLMLRPAAAQSAEADREIRIAVAAADLADPASLARVRRQVALAARALCDAGGLGALYRNGARRCRERVIADTERQLRARLAVRLAAGDGR